MINEQLLERDYVTRLTLDCEYCIARDDPGGSVARVAVAVPELDVSIVLCECDTLPDPRDPD